MTQVLSVNNIQDKNLNANNGLDDNQREEVVNTLVEQGLPRVFNPNNFISKIAQNYGISKDDARECLKEAVDCLEAKRNEKVKSSNQDTDKLYAQSGYFYPDKQTISIDTKHDGMDSLSAFGTFQRLRFGL